MHGSNQWRLLDRGQRQEGVDFPLSLRSGTLTFQADFLVGYLLTFSRAGRYRFTRKCRERYILFGLITYIQRIYYDIIRVRLASIYIYIYIYADAPVDLTNKSTLLVLQMVRDTYQQ